MSDKTPTIIVKDASGRELPVMITRTEEDAEGVFCIEVALLGEESKCTPEGSAK